jgi:hypothetical protein
MTLSVHRGSASEGQFAPQPARDTTRAPEAPAAVHQQRAPDFSSALSALGRQIDAGERLVRRALAPGIGGLSAAELIALQAGIYRYSEAVDLAAKLVDRAGSALKTTLQGGG